MRVLCGFIWIGSGCQGEPASGGDPVAEAGKSGAPAAIGGSGAGGNAAAGDSGSMAGRAGDGASAGSSSAAAGSSAGAGGMVAAAGHAADGGAGAAAGRTADGGAGAAAGSSAGAAAGSGGAGRGGSGDAGGSGTASSGSGGASGSAGMPMAGAGGTAGGGAVVTLADVQPIFDQHCVQCHDATNTHPPGYADLPLTADAAYASLVSQPAHETCGGTLVVPNDPSKSYLFHKLSDATPCEGARMPRAPEVGPSVSLSADEIATIQKWIASGAKR